MDLLAAMAPGWNPYRYDFNNPIGFVDPTGMAEQEIVCSVNLPEVEIVYDTKKERQENWKINYEGAQAMSNWIAEIKIQNEIEKGKDGENFNIPNWRKETNSSLAGLGFANGIKTEIFDYAVRSNYKSAQTWSQFKNLPINKQIWR